MDFSTFSSPMDVSERAITKRKILPIYSNVKDLWRFVYNRSSLLQGVTSTNIFPRWYEYHPKSDLIAKVKANIQKSTFNDSYIGSLIDTIEHWGSQHPEWSYLCPSGQHKGQWLFRHTMQTPYIDEGGHSIFPGDVCLHICWNNLLLCYMLPNLKDGTSVRYVTTEWSGVQTSVSIKTHFRKVSIEILSQRERDWLQEQEDKYGFRKQRNLTT
jgi:hypothetical protein